MIESILGRVSSGEDLSLSEMTDVIDGIMRGSWSELQIVLLLNALRAKGETIDEIAGAAVAMRRHMTPIRTHRTGVTDTCGTGGIGSELFNVSTAAAIVAAACGVPIAEHGNRSVTSKSGSADVLRQLGVNIEAPVAVVERCLDELGLCFCFAPLLHPAMKHVASARRKLGLRTIFNLLGPLCNPAAATFQLLGTGTDPLREQLAGALSRLGVTRAVVVTGADGLGEVSVFAPTHVVVVEHAERRQMTWNVSDFGLMSGDRQTALVDGPAASAEIIRQVLAGVAGSPRDLVLANAAAALWTAGISGDLSECRARAASAIDSGAARQLLAQLVEFTHREFPSETSSHAKSGLLS